MKYFNTKEKIIIAIVVVVGILLSLNGFNADVSLGGSSASQKCEVSSVTAIAVGNDVSTTILSIASNRAWATIGVADGETEPIFVSFDEGAAATVNNGVILTATSTTKIDFGLNTLFPYTGAVTGITGTASTTVMITECKFTS